METKFISMLTRMISVLVSNFPCQHNHYQCGLSSFGQAIKQLGQLASTLPLKRIHLIGIVMECIYYHPYLEKKTRLNLLQPKPSCITDTIKSYNLSLKTNMQDKYKSFKLRVICGSKRHNKPPPSY